MSDDDEVGRLEWFDHAGLGMFIHWGLYSLLGRGTWVMHNDGLSTAELQAVAAEFNPASFDADAWASLAARSGASYAVLTTRHHDGFCLFDSEVSDFTTAKGAARRDFVGEFAEACRAHDLRVGFYYSLLDWRFPGYFEPDRYPESKAALVEQVHTQVRELLTNYGKVDLLWFDGHWLADIVPSLQEYPERIPEFWESERLETMIRELQPEVVVNDRAGVPGDYATPEQVMRVPEPGRRWELCQTIGDWDQAWSDQRFNPTPIRKHAGQLILELVVAARNEGKVLLNVAPSADAVVPDAETEVMEQIGDWLDRHGDAIYGVTRSPLRGNSIGGWTFRGSTGYFSFACWPGSEIIISDVDGEIESARMLATGEAIGADLDPNGRLRLGPLPDIPPDPHVNVIEVQFADVPSRRQHADKAWWLGESAG